MVCPSELLPEPTIDEQRAHLQWVLDQVLDQPPFLRLARMKQIALATGGEWDLPHDTPGVYKPLLCSIKLSAVHVHSKDVADLPDLWIACARDTLKAMKLGDVA